MALFDLLGRRWAMGVLWTLSTNGPLTFRELQELCETISPAVLNQRLKELRAAKFIEKAARGYAATELGEHVYGQLLPLRETALAWASALNEEAEVGGEEGLCSKARSLSRTECPLSTQSGR
jgi:DNA-binding HxlR family transcriptional regulator